MIYPRNFEQKIGFNDIRTQLKGRCMSTLGTEWVSEQVQFLTDAGQVREKLQQAADFARFTAESLDETGDEFFDVREALLHVKPERTFLEELDLFNLKRSLQTVLNYSKAFTKTEGDDDDVAGYGNSRATFSAENIEEAGQEDPQRKYLYPALGRMAEQVEVFPQIVRRIDEVLNKYGKVKDTASTELLTIRHQLEVTVRSISHSLRSIISEAQSEGYIDRDVAPTLRDGRLVIPVAPSLKRKIKGIVHDESASGKTIFIEPAAVVDANNRIRELRAAERREIIRILQELTMLVRPHIPHILSSLQFLAQVDYLRAQHTFCEQYQCVIPHIVNGPCIEWVQARHPLLEQSLSKHGSHIVPLDATLRNAQRILLISGPNAGGKSVCLKTIGLLQYMAQCGMPIPVGERTRVGIFNDIFIDIGDEQSLEDDLSTYSSHLLNMKEMMRSAGKKSLLLIDEFGGGTEPQIGGALAEAILNRFVENGCYGVITTHFQNLKHYAGQSTAVVNGAMLYDRAQMQPLFLLQVGNPGSSFAIEIARKTGIPEDVIQYASDIVGKDYVMSDKYLQDIVRDKMYWENKRRNIRQREKQLDETLEKYEREMTAFNTERKTVMAEAKEQAKRLLEESNARIENTIRSIREAQAEREKTREVRRELTDFKEKLNEDATPDDAIARKIAKIVRRQQRKDGDGKSGRQRHAEMQANAAAAIARSSVGRGGNANSASTAGGGVGVNSYVRIKGQTSVGRVESIAGKSAKVLFGMMYTQVQLDRLEPAEKPQPENPAAVVSTFVSKQTRDAMYEKKLHFSPEIDIRGMHVDEALNAVSYFIDDSIQLEQARVRILHGTGTGALRELVRNYLRTVPGIRSFHDEHVQFGGAGITVVEIE